VTAVSHDGGPIIRMIRQSPFEVRFLLGGRRIGKISTWRAVEWSLLAPLDGGPYHAFPDGMLLAPDSFRSGLTNKALYPGVARNV
jgi:hypothetical protein